jgi:glutamine synthetase
MVDMAKKDIFPAVSKYINILCDTVNARKAACPNISNKPEEELIKKLSNLNASFYEKTFVLERELEKVNEIETYKERSMFFKDNVIPAMESLRSDADEMELICAKKYWPMPTYDDLLFFGV